MTANVFRATRAESRRTARRRRPTGCCPIAQQRGEADRAVDRRQRPRLRRHHHRLHGRLVDVVGRQPRLLPAGEPGGGQLEDADGDDQRAQGDRRGPRGDDERGLHEHPVPLRAALYPSPIPRASENRYPETGWTRLDEGGCPFWNSDSNWARDSLVPQIANNLKAVAAAKGVQFLDMRDAFSGREVCARTATQSTGTPTAETADRPGSSTPTTGLRPGVGQAQRLRAACDGPLLHADGRGREARRSASTPRPSGRRVPRAARAAGGRLVMDVREPSGALRWRRRLGGGRGHGLLRRHHDPQDGVDDDLAARQHEQHEQEEQAAPATGRGRTDSPSPAHTPASRRSVLGTDEALLGHRRVDLTERGAAHVAFLGGLYIVTPSTVVPAQRGDHPAAP